MRPSGGASGPADGGGPPSCPFLRALALEIADAPPSPNARERREMMERLVTLEARALAADSPLATLAAIREARIRARVADLLAWVPVGRRL